MKKKNSVLVVAAHPDDEVLGCGGTMARLAQAGHRVVVAVLGEGLTSRLPDREGGTVEGLATLWEQCREACHILGISEIFFGRLPDNRMDTLPLLDVVKMVEALIERYAPETIYTHHFGDLNIDHQVVFRAVLTAARPRPGCPVREVLSFEIPSSTEWSMGKLNDRFEPNVFVDISQTLDRKCEALARYVSETRPFPHPRSTEAIRHLARWRGAAANMEAAEAFCLIRKTW